MLATVQQYTVYIYFKYLISPCLPVIAISRTRRTTPLSLSNFTVSPCLQSAIWGRSSDDVLSVLVVRRWSRHDKESPSHVEQSVLEQVQVRKGLPSELYHITWWIQYSLARFTFNQGLPPEPTDVTELVPRSRSIACAAAFLSSLSSLVPECSALTAVISSDLGSLSLLLVPEI